VRHLLAAYDLHEDKLYGHVKPARPGIDPRQLR